jgi:Ankyrin repeats (3 copies)
MSGAAPRAEKLEDRTGAVTQRTDYSGNQGAPPFIESARVSGTNLASISDHGMTPLMRAARDGQAGTVRALLDRGAEVNAKRSDGFNALALAAFFGHSQVVWLLLENSAHVSSTGRSNTTPDRWADARGFFEIGDTLREAGLTKQEETSYLSAAVIDESARFARATEDEQYQRAGDPADGVEAAEIDEITVSEDRLVISSATVMEEHTASKSELTVEISPTFKPEDAPQEPVRDQPQRAIKLLPEIDDPPPLVVPKFHPGSAFLARIASSRKSLVALILAVLLGGSAVVAFLFPQTRKLAGGATVSDTNSLPKGQDDRVAQPGTDVSRTPPVTATEPTRASDANDVGETRADRDAKLPSEGESNTVSKKDIAADSQSESRTYPSSNNLVSTPSGDIRDLAATSASRSGSRAQRHRALSRAVKLKPQTVAEEQPRPAPLSVETSRSRSVVSTPDANATEVPSSQSSPLGIISGKPKSKVIQWP